MTAPEGPLTYTSLTSEALDIVHGYVRQQESVTSLAADMTATDLTFKVANATLITRGTVEVGDEVIYVQSADNTTGNIVVEPWGRAQSGSLAEPHPVGTKVTISPLFPKQRVRTAIYETLREMFPSVYAIGEAFIDVNVTRTNYPADPSAYVILECEWHLPGPSKMWQPMKRWRQNHTPTDLEIEIMGPLWPGLARVRYRFMKKNPADFGLTNDDLNAYGYSNQVRDVIIYGTVARLLASAMSSRTQVESMEALGRSAAVPTGDLIAASRYYYTLFRERLESERQQTMLRHPMKPHFTR
jgi:hypothetical protein